MMVKRTPYKDLIESRHPQHVARRAFWDLAWTSYVGGPGYLSASNLFSHRLENADDYRRRLARTYVLNYCRPVVDTYSSYLFRVGPAILPAEPIARLLNNADGRGRSLADLMRQVFTPAAVFGFVLLGVDRPRSDDTPATRAEEERLGLRTYVYPVLPPDFLNWSAGESGVLDWALVRQRGDAAGVDDIAPRADRVRHVYRLWTPESWTEIDEAGDILAEGANPFGAVPFVPLRFRETDDPITGESLLSAIVYVNREIFNLGSMLSEILYRQTFSQLVAEGSSHEYGEEGDITRLGTSSIFLYPEGRRPPEFISPDAAQADLLMRRIDALIDEVYRLANLTRGSVREGATASGISKAFDFLDTNHSLADAAAQIASAFERVIALAVPGWRGRIQFPGDFGVNDPSALLDEVERAIGLGVGPIFRRRLLERLARATLRELPAADRDEVIREIAAGDTHPSEE